MSAQSPQVISGCVLAQMWNAFVITESYTGHLCRRGQKETGWAEIIVSYTATALR